MTDVVRGLSNVPLTPVALGQLLTLAWALDGLGCTAVNVNCSVARWHNGHRDWEEPPRNPNVPQRNLQERVRKIRLPLKEAPVFTIQKCAATEVCTQKMQTPEELRALMGLSVIYLV